MSFESAPPYFSKGSVNLTLARLRFGEHKKNGGPEVLLGGTPFLRMHPLQALQMAVFGRFGVSVLCSRAPVLPGPPSLGYPSNQRPLIRRELVSGVPLHQRPLEGVQNAAFRWWRIGSHVQVAAIIAKPMKVLYVPVFGSAGASGDMKTLKDGEN